jgi:hypothetical protein
METVGPVSICGRELLRGWWRPIGLTASFMIFTASVRNILGTPSQTTSTKGSILLGNRCDTKLPKIIFGGRNRPTATNSTSLLRFLDSKKLRHTTTSRTPLYGRSARHPCPLPTQHTANTRDEHTRPRWNSNPWSDDPATTSLRPDLGYRPPNLTPLYICISFPTKYSVSFSESTISGYSPTEIMWYRVFFFKYLADNATPDLCQHSAVRRVSWRCNNGWQELGKR